MKKRDMVRADGKPFWDFLDEHQIEYDKDDFPFLTKAKIPQVKPVFDLVEYLDLESRGEALAYLYRGLGLALNYVGPVLDTELPNGFNDHTDRHTLWVSQRAMELLQRAGLSFDAKGYYDEVTEVLVTLVGMLHDLGNLLGRDAHSEESMRLLNNLFMQTQRQRKIWEAVTYAITFHEEPVLKAHKKALGEGIPLQWALVLADKMHVGRDRVGDRSFEAGLKDGAFENDVHILLESLVVRSTWYIEAGKFVWHLDFCVDQLTERFENFTKAGHGRLWVPKLLQKRFINQGKMYRETYKDLFLETYEPRVMMAYRAAKLLFPYIKGFEVKLSDTDTRGKVGSGKLTVWRK